MMALLGSETITLRVISAGTYTKGIIGGRTETDTSIVATVRNLTDSELQQLTEGERKMDPRRIITESVINLTDRVIIDSIEYKILKLQDNSRHGFLSHWQATALKVKEA